MDDLISEFIAETTESLSVLDLELVKLEQNPSDENILGNIFRIVHTIKGTCGFLGLPRLESVAHASENVLGKIREKELEATPQAVTLVLESLDTIKGLIDYLSQHGQEPAGEDSNLIGRLNRFADGGGAAEAPAAAATESAAPADEAPMDMSSFFKGDDELAALMAEKNGGHAPEEAKAAPPLALVEPKPEPKIEKPAAPAPAAAAPAPAGGGEGAGANQSIRVSIDVLENLMEMVSELVLTRNQLMQIARTREDKDFMAPIQQLSHITTELQEGVMKTRMQPIGNAWSKFPRLIRDLSLELNKKIDLKMVGAETELDRQLLEMIKDPLTHMVRNSCDHGLEGPADRRTAGKPEMGTVVLSAYHEGGHIIIEITDDGRGINIVRVRQKAIENGLATPAEMEAISDQQAMQFIFRAGFSTAEKVTAVSGRGVGMDVVRTNIEKIGGTIELSSEVGKGSKFSIKIPLTLAIVSVLIVEAGAQKFAIPQINVVELVRVAPGSEYSVESINGAPVLRLREKLLPLGVLGEVLGLQDPVGDWSGKEAFVAVCKVGGYDFGLVVDRVYDTEEIVVKPVAEILKSIEVYSGNTILGDGSIIMILDPNGIARSIGKIELNKTTDDDIIAAARTGERMTSFLLFTAGPGAPKAVPLEMVSRLEEIDVASIEIAGDYPVVQYRDELMRLITLNDETKIPNEGIAQVIVFTYDRQTVGLVVESIIDILHAPLDVKLTFDEGNCMGSMVIADRATDMIDVAQMLSQFIGGPQKQDESKTAENREIRVLLVEDSPFFRNLTVPFLGSAGYVITAAEHGNDALNVIAQAEQPFDAIVTDIEMPGMNGFEFAAACRKLPATSALPIIAYTASLSDDAIRRAREVGMSDCIVKTDRPGLLQALSQCLATRRREIAA